MTDKNQYQAFLRAKIKGAVEEAKAASTIKHNGVKGAILEILISKLFRPLLPSDIGIGTGQIIEASRGLMSNQVDIVLYDRNILPPALYDEKVGIFPIEAVLYAIEVKTTLTSNEMQKAHRSAIKLLGFQYLPGTKTTDGKQTVQSIERVRCVVFALNTDLTGKNEAKHYEKIYKKNQDYPHIRAICVAGSQYWYDNGEYWVSFKEVDKYDEVLGFIGGVTNTYKSVARARNFPSLGNYIVPASEAILGPQTAKINRIDITCEGCGYKARFKPEFHTSDLTVVGTINSATPCPECGGLMKTKEGKYEIKGGKLAQDYHE